MIQRYFTDVLALSSHYPSRVVQLVVLPILGLEQYKFTQTYMPTWRNA